MKTNISVLLFVFFSFCSCSAHGNSLPVSEKLALNYPPVQEGHIEIRIYPNPFKEYVSLEININNSIPTYIKLFDIIGVEIMNIDLANHVANNGIYTISLKDLQPGVYFCNVYSDKKLLESKKIISSRN
ncbi:MAG: T9SS type A sorting domain-containing protein [Bacteroidota bacterium]|nr:T9SS type A sorting domain-containing protein [Bacteroidota bacterium]